eukprot:11285187-Alexandrium_andersonii.AAC.1
MSASLVGSEMCIRDRYAPPMWVCRATPTQQLSLAREREREDRERYVPVSYTHLTLPTICSV